ncbi:alpha/beta hydrolase [Rothia aerolata]|nr:alpha/beta hydrolase [Rothia aerolata]
MTTFTHQGTHGELFARMEAPVSPRYLVLLAHGYGEHIGRYEELFEKITQHGGAIYAQDHQGHGKSEGERAYVADFESVVEDLHKLYQRAASEYPQLPVFLIGHSMGGMIAARYTQLYGTELTATVLSGPLLEGSPLLDFLLENDDARTAPIDSMALSRDPEVGEVYKADPLVWQGEWKIPMLQSLKSELELIKVGGRLETPTMWLVGGEDPLCPPSVTEPVWEKIKPVDSRQKVYPGARHEIFNETNRAEVFEDVLTFIVSYL